MYFLNTTWFKSNFPSLAALKNLKRPTFYGKQNVGFKKACTLSLPSASSQPEQTGFMFQRVCMKEASTMRSPLA